MDKSEIKKAVLRGSLFNFTATRMLMRCTPFLLIVSLLFLASCTSSSEPGKVAAPLTEREVVQRDLDRLKDSAQEGDLIVRLGDDMLSYSIRFLSQTDPSYSHTGVVVMRNGEKRVCHIYPDEAGADTVRYDPIDSFASPVKNLQCGLYRYTLSGAEKSAFLAYLAGYEKAGAHFDRLYDLATDHQVYCSEMIAKSLARSTANRIAIGESKVPKKMLPLMTSYFKDEGVSKKRLSEGGYIALDDLYLHPACSSVFKINLRPSS